MPAARMPSAGIPSPESPKPPGPIPVAGTPPSAPNTKKGGDEPEQPDAPIPFDPSTTARAPKPAPGKPEGGLPDLSGEQWAMAPIRWFGNTSTSGNAFLDGTGGRNMSIANTLSVQASSFVVAPYIAQWSGNLGMSSNNNSYNSPTAASIKSESASRSLGGSVLLLPLSQFPFSANVNYATGESKSGATTTPTSSTGFALRQQYRTLDGRDNYSASYNRNSFTSGLVSSTSQSMQGSGTGRRVFGADHALEGEHMFSATVGYTPNSNSGLGPQARLLNGNATHAWTVHEDLSFSSQLAVSNSRADQFLGNVLTKSDSTVIAGSSSASWRPFEDEPLNLSGGVSASRSVTRGQEPGASVGTPATPKDIEITSVGVSGAANYRFSQNLFGAANASFTTTANSVSGSRTSGVAGGASAGYSGDPMKFGGFDYSWGLSGGATASSFSGQSTVASLSGGANHSVNRNFVVDERQSVNVSATQGLNFTQFGGGNALGLTNGAGLSWRASYGSALTASMGANAGYSVTTAQAGLNQLVSGSLMGSVAYQVSSRAALTLNANFNASRSLVPSVGTQTIGQVVFDGRQQQINGSIALGYTHTAPFSIRNLNYSANALWIGNQYGQRVDATFGTLPSQTQTSASLNQMLDYRVGRLSFRLNGTVATQQSGKATTSIYGMVTREFDGFFDGRW
jgi:hypothetical protein